MKVAPPQVVTPISKLIEIAGSAHNNPARWVEVIGVLAQRDEEICLLEGRLESPSRGAELYFRDAERELSYGLVLAGEFFPVRSADAQRLGSETIEQVKQDALEDCARIANSMEFVLTARVQLNTL